MIDVVDFEFCKEEEIMWSVAMVFNIHQMIAIECRQVVFLFCIVSYIHYVKFATMNECKISVISS